MGKPFKKEIEKIEETFDWALKVNVSNLEETLRVNLNKPTYIVGSGGSLSACHYAAMLLQLCGSMAKAVTPLELFYYKKSIRNSNVIFISASGKNTDILFAYETSVNCEPNKIINLCMKENTPLSVLSSIHSISETYEYKLPTGKDGFLATNSLIAFFAILYRSISYVKTESIIFNNENTEIEVSQFLKNVSSDFTFLTLYGGWGLPVATDIESKLAEAALGNILLSDYRNFGHGRHHWLDKRANKSAIIALITPEEEDIATKTLSMLPKEIPVLKIDSQISGSLSSIDLLIKSFCLIQQLGEKQSIDPGKPGVPDFGSKLYNLKYKSFYKFNYTKVPINEILSITRKANISSFDNLSLVEKEYWRNAYKTYKKNIESNKYGILILDYDGTLCAHEERYKGIGEKVSKYLKNILEKGIVVGIATGRGKSVRHDLQRAIPQNLWQNVIVGYYNCADIGELSNDNLPIKDTNNNAILERLYTKLAEYTFPNKIVIELKPQQITIENKDKSYWDTIRLIIIQLVMSQNLPNIQVLESSHSIDIIDVSVTVKSNILKSCVELSKKLSISSNYVCIGDKGKWPGNDYQLLANRYSLSVDEVSPLMDSAWNFSPPGLKNIESTLYYLSCMKIEDNELTIKIK